MKLWTSERFQRRLESQHWATPATERGKSTHLLGVCLDPLLEDLDLPAAPLDLWGELHDTPSEDRLKLTVEDDDGDQGLFVEGRLWDDIDFLTRGQICLLRRLGLLGGKRKALYLQVIYREV